MSRMNPRAASSVRRPAASNLVCAWPISTSGLFNGCMSRKTQHRRRSYCARAEPAIPAAAPIIATGLPAKGWSGGRGGAHHRHRFAGERLVGRTRGPVDRVLQHAGHRIVVFGGNEEQRVGRGDLGSQALDWRREAERTNILVVERDRADIGGLDGHLRRLLLDRGAQCSLVERALAQAAANRQNGDASSLAHLPSPMISTRSDPTCAGLPMDLNNLKIANPIGVVREEASWRASTGGGY